MEVKGAQDTDSSKHSSDVIVLGPHMCSLSVSRVLYVSQAPELATCTCACGSGLDVCLRFLNFEFDKSLPVCVSSSRDWIVLSRVFILYKAGASLAIVKVFASQGKSILWV